MTVTFGIGAALAGLAGALAAPIYQVSPLMGSDILLVVFAIIVIGGMGSISGTILASYCMALVESMTLAVYPQGANLMIFVFMCVVLSVRRQGLFGIHVVPRPRALPEHACPQPRKTVQRGRGEVNDF